MMLGRKGGLLAILVVVSLMFTQSLSGETLQKSLSGQTVKEQAQQLLRSQNAQLQSCLLYTSKPNGDSDGRTG